MSTDFDLLLRKIRFLQRGDEGSQVNWELLLVPLLLPTNSYEKRQSKYFKEIAEFWYELVV